MMCSPFINLTTRMMLPPQIVWNNRIATDVHNRYAMCTVNGTHFPVNKVHPINTRICSHKTKSAKLAYKIAIFINGGEIVHVNGPFNSGEWQDIKIFRAGLKQKFLPREMVEADKD